MNIELTLKCQLVHQYIVLNINTEHNVKQRLDYRVKYVQKYSSSKCMLKI